MPPSTRVPSPPASPRTPVSDCLVFTSPFEEERDGHEPDAGYDALFGRLKACRSGGPRASVPALPRGDVQANTTNR